MAREQVTVTPPAVPMPGQRPAGPGSIIDIATEANLQSGKPVWVNRYCPECGTLNGPDQGECRCGYRFTPLSELLQHVPADAMR